MGWGLRLPKKVRRDVDDELAAHLEARIEQLVEGGMAPDQARAEALRRFGNLDAGRRALYRAAIVQPPRLRIGDRLHDLVQDIRYVLRTLARAPSFTLGVVGTLALGLGINAAVFRVADFVLLRAPAGVSQPERVRRVEVAIALGRGAPLPTLTFPWATAERVAGSGAFDRAGSYVVQSARDGAGRDLTVNYIDGNYLDTLGVRPAIGRGFTTDEGTPGRAIDAAIVSHDYWRQVLGGASIDERPQITVGLKKFPIVGVMPGGFRGVDLDPVDVWLPLGAGSFGYGTVNGVVIPWYRSTMMRAVRTIGRTPAGASDAAIAERIDAALKTDEEELRRTARVIPVAPVGGTANQDTNAMLGRLALVSALILVIACANAANLMLARGFRRQPEIAIRMAIGASRGRVTRLLVVESVVLAALAGVTAAIAAFWTAESLRRLLFPDAKWTAGAIDRRTLIVTTVLALVAGIVAGLAPAIQSTGRDLVSRLKHHRLIGGARSRATRTALIVVQTALSLALLIASGLLIRSLDRLNAVPMGFSSNGLVTVSLAGNARQAEPASAAEVTAQQVAQRLIETGQVEAAAIASHVPFGATAMRTTKVIGATSQPADNVDDPLWTAVAPGYFSVMRTRTTIGRTFTEADGPGAEPVAVINESMARAYFNGAPPSSACVLPVGLSCHRIVGVVEDVRDTPNGAEPRLRYYLPVAQSDVVSPQGVVARVRTRTAGGRVSADEARYVASLARSILPTTQRATIEVVNERVARALRPWFTATWLFGAIGVLALGLSCIGLYSVMTYVASERIHELGVRVVLGATRGDIARLVVVSGLRMTCAGCALGLVTALVGGRFLGTLLFGVSSFDLLTYGVALVCLSVASVLAVLPPALRASRVDPISAFRS